MHSQKHSEGEKDFRPAVSTQEKGCQDWSHYFEHIQRDDAKLYEIDQEAQKAKNVDILKGALQTGILKGKA